MVTWEKVFHAEGTASTGAQRENNEGTESGVAVVWGPRWRVSCDEVRKVSRVRNCRVLQAVVRSLGFIPLCNQETLEDLKEGGHRI